MHPCHIYIYIHILFPPEYKIHSKLMKSIKLRYLFIPPSIFSLCNPQKLCNSPREIEFGIHTECTSICVYVYICGFFARLSASSLNYRFALSPNFACVTRKNLREEMASAFRIFAKRRSTSRYNRGISGHPVSRYIRAILSGRSCMYNMYVCVRVMCASARARARGTGRR